MRIPNRIRSSNAIDSGMPFLANRNRYGIQLSADSKSQTDSLNSALVYVIGTLAYDFGDTVRRDYFLQNIDPVSPDFRNDLMEYLAANPRESTAIYWTINIDETPVYAVQPAGLFAKNRYRQIHDFLGVLPDEDIPVQLSIAGKITGSVVLLQTGGIVPVIAPSAEMFEWAADSIANALEDGIIDEAEKAEILKCANNYHKRVYRQLRNLGQTPHDRAVNFAATIGYQRLIHNSQNKHLELDGIEAKPSATCRPNSDCWDLQLTLFDPEKPYRQAKTVYGFTVDVAEIDPVVLNNKIFEWKTI